MKYFLAYLGSGVKTTSILKCSVYIKPKDSWLHAFLWCMKQTSRDRVNSRRVRTHEKNSGDAVRRLGTIIQSIFCAQSGASIRLTVWKWSGESRYPGALPPMLENFRRAFSPGPTDCPWVSEDATGWAESVSTDEKLLKALVTAIKKHGALSNQVSMHASANFTSFEGLGKNAKIASSGRKNWVAKMADVEFTQVCNS